MPKTLLQHHVELLHLNSRAPFPSEIKQGTKVIADRLASYPNGGGAVILLFKKRSR